MLLTVVPAAEETLKGTAKASKAASAAGGAAPGPVSSGSSELGTGADVSLWMEPDSTCLIQ
jgi:hypothetical protein